MTDRGSRSGNRLLLDLDTWGNGPLILIDGHPYYVLQPGELGILPRYRWNRLYQSLFDLNDQALRADLADQPDDQLDQLMTATQIELVRIVIPDATYEMLASLTPDERERIIMAFGQQLLAETTQIEDDGALARPIDWGEIVPELQSFYAGSDPERWLWLPMDILVSFQTMQPRLQARRNLNNAQVAIYPHVKQQDARNMWSTWKAIAYPISGMSYNSAGQVVLHTANDLRRWLASNEVYFDA